MGGLLLLPRQSSKERKIARRETRGLLNCKTISGKFKVLLMISGGLRGGDEYLCRFGSGSRSICAVGDVTVVPGVSPVNSTRKPALIRNSDSAFVGCRSTQVVVLINTIAADDSHQLLRQLRLVVACLYHEHSYLNINPLFIDTIICC